MRRRSDYHYDLPPEQIAQAPADRRDGSRLLVVGPGSSPGALPGALEDRWFRDIVELVPAGAVVVVNDTRVFPARLRTAKPTGGAVELLFLERLAIPAHGDLPGGQPGMPGDRWRCMARSSKALKAGMVLAVLDRSTGQPTGETVTLATGRAEDTTVVVEVAGDAHALLDRAGEVPLPPYIARSAGTSTADAERYQTVYARERGAVAAPTAGLHFTPELLAALGQRGCQVATVTLHVGLGTFAPMRAERIDDHEMHEERYSIPAETAALVSSGRPVVAVGTTCVRALESAAAASREPGDPRPGRVVAGEGTTRLFITPGYRFQVVDWLITNFHLPESTLLMLVCAFAGYDRVMAAYRHAVAAGYRFFSYGDAMLLGRAAQPEPARATAPGGEAGVRS